MTSRLIKRAPSRSNLDPTAAGKHYVHAEPWYAVGSMETDSISEPTVPVNGAHATDSGRGSKALLHEDAPRKSGLLYQIFMAVQILLIPLSTSINIASVALALATPWDLPPSMFSRLQPIAGILAALLLGISLFAKAGAAVLLRFPGMQGFKAISWAFGCGQRLCIRCSIEGGRYQDAREIMWRWLPLPATILLSSTPCSVDLLPVFAAAVLAAPFVPLVQLQCGVHHAQNRIRDMLAGGSRRFSLGSLRSLAFMWYSAYTLVFEVVPMAVMSGALLAVAVLSGAPALVLCVFVAGFVVNASCALLNLSTLGFTVRLADVLAGYRMASLALPEEGLPLLHYAVLLRDTDTLRFLLEEGLGENTRDMRGRTAFHLLASRAEIGMTEDKPVDLVVDEERPYAVQLEAFELLREAGADVFEVDDDGMTPLHGACNAGSSELAVKMIERIFQMEGEESALAFIRAPDSKSRSTALHSAAEAGDAGLCARLIELGADVHATDLARHTALHKAAQSGSVATVRCLIEYGADVDATDWEGTTPWLTIGEIIDKKQDDPSVDLSHLLELKDLVGEMTQIALGKSTRGSRKGSLRESVSLSNLWRSNPGSRSSSRRESRATSRSGSVHGASAAGGELARHRRLGDGMPPRYVPSMGSITEEKLERKLGERRF